MRYELFIIIIIINNIIIIIIIIIRGTLHSLWLDSDSDQWLATHSSYKDTHCD